MQEPSVKRPNKLSSTLMTVGRVIVAGLAAWIVIALLFLEITPAEPSGLVGLVLGGGKLAVMLLPLAGVLLAGTIIYVTVRRIPGALWLVGLLGLPLFFVLFFSLIVALNLDQSTATGDPIGLAIAASLVLALVALGFAFGDLPPVTSPLAWGVYMNRVPRLRRLAAAAPELGLQLISPGLFGPKFEGQWEARSVRARFIDNGMGTLLWRVTLEMPPTAWNILGANYASFAPPPPAGTGRDVLLAGWMRANRRLVVVPPAGVAVNDEAFTALCSTLDTTAVAESQGGPALVALRTEPAGLTLAWQVRSRAPAEKDLAHIKAYVIAIAKAVDAMIASSR